MSVRGGLDILRGLFDSVFRPERFVAAQEAVYSNSWKYVGIRAAKLTLVYLSNLLLYAIPLTLTGVGFASVPSTPAWFASIAGFLVADTLSLWEFCFAVYRNSFFITGMVGVVLITYHAAVVYARASRGFLQSFHTVVYTSSAYLAAIYTVTTTLSTTPGVDRAEQFVLAIQKIVFVGIITVSNRLLPTRAASPFRMPEQIPLGGFSGTGRVLLMLLVLASLYFLYTLYLGARINHQTGRIEGLTVLLAVIAAPIVYVAGSVLFSTIVLPFLIQ